MPLAKSFTTTSGLLDEYEMTLSEVWFGKDPQYMGGKQTIMVVRGEAELDGEVVDDEHQIYYSLGDGWEPDNDGDSAVHNAGKVQFNSNSNIGKFITAVVDTGKEALDELESRGTEAFEAATWQGLRFRFERKRFVFKDRETKQENEYFVELPVEFLGTDEATTPGKKKAPAKSTGRRTRKLPETEDADADEAPAPRRRRSSKPKVDAKLRAAVVEFAAEWEEHGDFMNAVLDADEFDQADALQDPANEELLNDILDESGSIWTESR